MKNIDNFFFAADDLNESKKFYTELLGLEVKFDFSPMGMMAFRIGQDEPAIILKEKSSYPDASPSLWLEVADVKASYEELKAKGIQFLSEPFEIKTGWAVEFLDPSGNRLGITDYTKK